MKLQKPFFISAHLAPALKLSDLTISLTGVRTIRDDGFTRIGAAFRCDHPDWSITSTDLRSGAGGFESIVEIFVALLDFLAAAGESRPGGDTSELFPPALTDWCRAHCDEIGDVQQSLRLYDGETTNHALIEG